MRTRTENLFKWLVLVSLIFVGCGTNEADSERLSELKFELQSIKERQVIAEERLAQMKLSQTNSSTSVDGLEATTKAVNPIGATRQEYAKLEGRTVLLEDRLNKCQATLQTLLREQPSANNQTASKPKLTKQYFMDALQKGYRKADRLLRPSPTRPELSAVAHVG